MSNEKWRMEKGRATQWGGGITAGQGMAKIILTFHKRKNGLATGGIRMVIGNAQFALHGQTIDLVYER